MLKYAACPTCGRVFPTNYGRIPAHQETPTSYMPSDMRVVGQCSGSGATVRS